LRLETAEDYVRAAEELKASEKKFEERDI